MPAHASRSFAKAAFAGSKGSLMGTRKLHSIEHRRTITLGSGFVTLGAFRVY